MSLLLPNRMTATTLRMMGTLAGQQTCRFEAQLHQAAQTKGIEAAQDLIAREEAAARNCPNPFFGSLTKWTPPRLWTTPVAHDSDIAVSIPRVFCGYLSLIAEGSDENIRNGINGILQLADGKYAGALEAVLADSHGRYLDVIRPDIAEQGLRILYELKS